MDAKELLQSLTFGANKKSTLDFLLDDDEEDVEYVVKTSLTGKQVIAEEKEDIEEKEDFEDIEELVESEENIEEYDSLPNESESSETDIYDDDLFNEDNQSENETDELSKESEEQIQLENSEFEEVPKENSQKEIKVVKSAKEKIVINRNGNPFKRGPRRKKEPLFLYLEDTDGEVEITEVDRTKKVNPLRLVLIDIDEEYQNNELEEDFVESQNEEIEHFDNTKHFEDTEGTGFEEADLIADKYCNEESEIKEDFEEFNEDYLKEKSDFIDDEEEKDDAFLDIEDETEYNNIETRLESEAEDFEDNVEKENEESEEDEPIEDEDEEEDGETYEDSEIEDIDTDDFENNDVDEKFANCKYHMGMDVEDFLRQNPNYREALYVEHFYNKDYLQDALRKGLILMQKGRYCL